MSLIADVGRMLGMSGAKVQSTALLLLQSGIMEKDGDSIRLNVTVEDVLDRAAFLRGFGYAKSTHRDQIQVEITLTPPTRPSRLMDALPKQGFGWAELNDTKDSLVELASAATSRLVIISPFIDEDGLVP